MSSFWILFKYIIVFIPTSLFYIEKHNKTKKNIFEKIGILFLIVVSYLRYMTGRDYFNYEYIYQYIHDGGDRFLYTEPLFYFILKTFGNLGLSYQFLIGTISVFYIIVVYIYILKRISLRYRYVAIFMFLIIGANYFTSVTVMRQYLAIAFFVIAIDNLINNRKIYFYVFIIMGALSHISMWLILPLVFLTLNLKKNMYYILLIPLLLFLLMPNLLPNMIDAVLNTMGIDKAFRSYLHIEPMQFNIRSILKNFLFVIVLIQYFIFIKFLKYKKYEPYIKLLLVGLLLHLYIAVGMGIFFRLLGYFYIFYPFAIVLFLEKTKIKNGVVMLFFLVLFIGNHIKQILLPPEYSKYYAQYQLIIFKDKSTIQQDKHIYDAEEKELLLRKIK